ncbi:DUF502 domain-containing protein [Phycisphaera mikurensis]|uniref:DUF502 domain-containing protein n=1 Tax=Phycisphaera mikurensis (strain NBRC 102666 / KCTC 22515 / FYK2301M01) TaxID=1142394 RepID=I0IAV8_PHYMF|nr:DUF502 domain-containing protein [Phycisphaera mikurensis]MBB6442630.1 putative membrane protein [Phycisphaera mikurensis]BAM02396.1 hypothetical protein PSMK_02370 [Phycisphaera mikurensis NBRC 102666]
MEGPQTPQTAPPEAAAVSPGKPRRRDGFRRLFIRGLAIVLPTVLTIWLLSIAYGFVDQRIGAPINAGLREVVIRFSEWPPAAADDYRATFDRLPQEIRDDWEDVLERYAASRDRTINQLPAGDVRARQLEWQQELPIAKRLARRHAFIELWDDANLGGWPVLNLIGVVLAIVLVYILGAFLSRSIGKRLWKIGEGYIQRVPLVGRVYPAFKQITDFVFGDETEEKLSFNRVVAVEYPRRGLWSVGMVTGNTLRTIQDAAGRECLTVFVPSSPTPFTGYVITTPVDETVELPITVEDALKFAVSGGVVVPPAELIDTPTGTAGRRPAAAFAPATAPADAPTPPPPAPSLPA